MRLKVSSAIRWPFCLGLNVLNTQTIILYINVSRQPSTYLTVVYHISNECHVHVACLNVTYFTWVVYSEAEQFNLLGHTVILCPYRYTWIWSVVVYMCQRMWSSMTEVVTDWRLIGTKLSHKPTLTGCNLNHWDKQQKDFDSKENDFIKKIRLKYPL